MKTEIFKHRIGERDINALQLTGHPYPVGVKEKREIRYDDDYELVSMNLEPIDNTIFDDSAKYNDNEYVEEINF